MMSSFHIRDAQPDDVPGLARVHVDCWRTTYRGIVPDDYLAKLNYDDSESRWRRILGDAGSTSLVYVALDDNETVIGFVSGGPARPESYGFTGEVYAIYLLKEFQRSGIGGAMLSAATRSLAGHGFDSLLIWVLTENPSCRFYESMGGVLVAEKKVLIGGTELDEVGYGWRDIGGLVG
jgi:ribosomal protein S18 acetylase RimI-like enzyme